MSRLGLYGGPSRSRSGNARAIITNFVNGQTFQLEMLDGQPPTSVTVGGVLQGALTDQGNDLYTGQVVRSNGTITLRPDDHELRVDLA